MNTLGCPVFHEHQQIITFLIDLTLFELLGVFSIWFEWSALFDPIEFYTHRPF